MFTWTFDRFRGLLGYADEFYYRGESDTKESHGFKVGVEIHIEEPKKQRWSVETRTRVRGSIEGLELKLQKDFPGRFKWCDELHQYKGYRWIMLYECHDLGANNANEIAEAVMVNSLPDNGNNG